MKELIVKSEDLALVENNFLNKNQLQLLLKRTPEKYIRYRPAKGGGKWAYVTGGYVKKMLNLMFGWDWDFEIIDEMIRDKEAIVKGRLTCRTAGRTIVKNQYGNKDVIYKKGTKEPLSIGNDLKAAATDCLKKCAAEIGIASDIYNQEEFREVIIQEEPERDRTKERIVMLINGADSMDELKRIQAEEIPAEYLEDLEIDELIMSKGLEL